MSIKDFIKATEFPCGLQNIGKEPLKSNIVTKLLMPTQVKQTSICRE